MMRISIAIAALAFALLLSNGHAQEAQQPVTAEQRITMQLGSLLMQNAALAAEVEKDKLQIAALQKQLEAAKPKAEQK